MKQHLRLSTKQSLSMTPQLQQAIRLLQLSAAELEQEIREALESNPLLELIDKPGEVIDLPVDTNWDNVEPEMTFQHEHNSPSINTENFNTAMPTLQEHLYWQIDTTQFSDFDKLIAITIVDSINDDGYLEASLEDIKHSLQDNYPEECKELEINEVLAVLHRIQQFDPLGIAARDLQECMAIQLAALSTDNPLIIKCRELVAKHLDLLAKKDYAQIKKLLQLNESDLQSVLHIITHLNPRPGIMLEHDNAEYIIPDVVVTKNNNRWLVNLNTDVSNNIRINPSYSALIKRADSSRDNQFLREQLNEAKWLISSIKTRNETLLKVATYIVQHQIDFLEHGAEQMHPLTLHEVSAVVGLNESTISRVTNKKYIHTPQGLFELKYFFSSRLLTNDGADCSSTAIKAIIKQLVDKESASKPLSDTAITDIIHARGIKIARRTVAKYRESLRIKSSSQRKK